MQAFDVAVLMVSLDEPEKNAAFAASLDAAVIPVVSDPQGKAAKEYGVLALGGLYARRWTIYIDAEGRIAEIDRDVSPKSAGEEMLETLERLGFERRTPSGQASQTSRREVNSPAP